MKKTTKLTALLLALVLSLSLAACSGKPGAESSAPAESKSGESAQPSAAPAGDETYVVGICQLLPHDALNAATQGFKDALKEEFGDSVEIKEGNAGGEPTNCTTIIDGFIAEEIGRASCRERV